MPVESVWGLDIGQCALKAVRARSTGQLIEVLAFDHVEYRQALSTAGTDSSATIREALQTFLSRNDVEGSAFAVSIAAGRSALIRFIKLPPVDRRKVPDIVRYEATQQIPFPLEDVIWDHQVVERNYGPGEELEVGIFAMRREAIFDFLSNLMVSGIEVDNIQLSALALYNCVHFDQPVEEGAIMAVDIGAENTNLVVVEGNNVWIRSLPIGGNDFTRAIATKYSLEFDQAEQLKRSMDRSKKAPEIFEALRPSLRSLLDEIQRSAGYYRSVHKSAKFVKLLGFGNGFKMYGVQRFLEAGLAYPVEVFQKTNNFVVDAATNQQFFKKSAPAFGAALGLVAQSLGFGGVRTSLMPPTIIKERILKRKKPALIAAAVLLGAAFAWPVAAAYTKPVAYDLEKHPVNRELADKMADRKKFDDMIGGVGKWQREVDAIASVRAMRSEELKAFDVLTASLPTNLGSPYYIQQMAMVSDTRDWLQTVLIAPQLKGETKGKETILPGTVVAAPVFIKEASQAVKETGGASATSTNLAKLSLAELEVMRDKAIDERLAREDAQRARREAKQNERAARKAGPAQGGPSAARLETKEFPRFDGVAELVDLLVETADPSPNSYFRTLVEQLRTTLGVMYCDCVSITPLEVWENPADHSRLDAAPRDPNSGYTHVTYSVGKIQWVYKEGSTVKIELDNKQAPASAAGKAGAPATPAKNASAAPPAPVSGEDSGGD